MDETRVTLQLLVSIEIFNDARIVSFEISIAAIAIIFRSASSEARRTVSWETSPYLCTV